MNRTKYKTTMGITMFYLTLIFSAFGQVKTDVRNLSPSQTIDSAISGDETHIYQFKLQKGKYTAAEVEQKNIDVIVSLFAPDGKLVIEMDGKDGRLWRESLSAMDGEKGGLFRVEVKAYKSANASGSYKIRLAEIRQAETKDQKRLEAEQHLSAGRRFYEQGALSFEPTIRESKFELAIKEFETALKFWREIGAREWEAITLVNLGWTYRDLSKSEQSIAAHIQASAIFRETGDKTGEGKAANGIGLVYSNLDPNDRARMFYEQALAIRQNMGDKLGESNTLNNLARLYSNSGQYEKAFDYYERALSIRRDIKARILEGDTLNELGRIYQNLNQMEKARSYYEEALKIYQELNAKYGQAVVLANIGNTYSISEDNQQALKYYTNALKLYREIADKEQELVLLSSIGIIYENAEQESEALKYYTDALKLSREIKNKVQEAYALNNIGDVHKTLNNSQNSLASYKQALSIYREIVNKDLEAKTLSNIGDVYIESLEKSSESLIYYNDALMLYRETVNRFGEAQTLNKIGGVYFLKGEKTKARDLFEQALQIDESIGNKNEKAETLLLIAATYSTSMLPEKARGYLEEALKIYRETGNRNEEALVLMSLSYIYADTNENEKAVDYANQASAIFLKLGGEAVNLIPLLITRLSGSEQEIKEDLKKAYSHYDRRLTRLPKEEAWAHAIRLMMVSFFYSVSEDNEKALEYIDQGLKIARSENIKHLEAVLLMYKGLLQSESEPQTAIATLKKSLELFRNVGDKTSEAGMNLAIGSVYGELYDDDKNADYLTQASNYFNQALIAYQITKEKNMEAYLLSELMKLWEEGKQPKLAIIYGKQAISAFQGVRGELSDLDKKLQDSYLERVEDSYRQLADLLISEGRLPEAQAVLDLLKENEYKQISRRRSNDNPDTVPYSKAEAEVIAIMEKFALLGREQIELQKEAKEAGANFSAEKRQRLDELYKEIKIANEAFQNALVALTKSEVSVKEQVEYIQSQQNLQRTLKEINKSADTGAVALYTVIGNEEVTDGKSRIEGSKSKFGWVVLVTGEGRKAYPIDVTDLEETVFQFRSALSSTQYNPEPIARRLYDKIFRQTSEKQKTTLQADLETVLGKYKNKTILWSLDGVLRYIPMAALHDGRNYLVEKYRHIVFTKESLPYFNDNDIPKWQVLGLGVSEAKTIDAPDGKKLSFAALDGVKRELQDIVRQTGEKTGILEGIRKLDKEFTRDTSLRLMREGDYPVIHISSHYRFNPVDQIASFLLVGDGKLTFGDIKNEYGLFSSVDLLTLSACDTAMSGNGKESEGFAYLAQSLGAKTVLASLWKVSDTGTPELMIQFYKLRAENQNMPKGEAFRQAQLTLLRSDEKTKESSFSKRSDVLDLSGKTIELPLYEKDPKTPYAHPHYWASFILIGNWR